MECRVFAVANVAERSVACRPLAASASDLALEWRDAELTDVGEATASRRWARMQRCLDDRA